MKFLVLVKATKDSEAGKHPEERLIVETMKLNEEMMKAFPLDKNGGELEIRRLIDVGDFAVSEEANAMHERLEKQVRR